MNENILCDRISALRKASGMTQEQLATRLGVTYQAVSKWENAQSCPDIMLLPALAEAFHVSIDELFGREPALVPVPVEEAPTEQEPRVIYGALPWEDDDSLYAVLFRGHELLENKPLPRYAAALCEKVELCCDGDVSGDVSSAFSVSVGGQVGGDVDAGADVTCGSIGGDVDAGADVNCGDVSGDVDAGGSVTCTGSIGGDVDAGRDVSCGMEPEEEKPFQVSDSGKGRHVVIEIKTNPDGPDPEIKINELTSSARDSAKKAGQTAKDISAMVSKYFEERFK